MSSKLHPPMDKTMTTEQFTQVVDAILQGKYSWACVLILRFAGYNPLHYIPYRTYNRLAKENGLGDRTEPHTEKDALSSQPRSRQPVMPGLRSNGIRDLNYLEPLSQRAGIPKGGSRFNWSISYLPDLN